MSNETPSTRANTMVVLLAPEALGLNDDPGFAKLKSTLSGSHWPIRVLIRLRDMNCPELVEAVKGTGVDYQLLVSPKVELPSAGAGAVQMPPGILDSELDEFAVAMADVVLVSPPPPDPGPEPLRSLAERRRKVMVVPGLALPPLPAAEPGITAALDPVGKRQWRRSWFGRLEQFMLEVLAFNWKGCEHEGVGESWGKIKDTFRCQWRPKSYFLDPRPPEEISDRPVFEATHPIVGAYQRFDRSALFGSYIHRDLVWFAYFGAAFAVLFAVLGALLHNAHDPQYHDRYGTLSVAVGIAELVLLVAVAGCVLAARRWGLHERWTACRVAAEQLRIARMCLPLLVAPPVLQSPAAPPEAEAEAEAGPAVAQFGRRAVEEVVRTIRDQGLRGLDKECSVSQAAAWLDYVVTDQVGYHHKNHHKLEAAETRLEFITSVLFLAAIVAVALHFFVESSALLLVTAAGPAFASACHGAETRLGIVHRIALSRDIERDLRSVQERVRHLPCYGRAAPDTEESWAELRTLANFAADAMGREVGNWHGLVRRTKEVFP